MKLLRGAISLTLLLFCLFCWPSSVSASSRRRYNRRRRRKYVPPACGAGQRRNYHSAVLGHSAALWYDCTSCVAGRYMSSGTEQLGGYITNIGGSGSSCPSCYQYSCPGICQRGTTSAAGATGCTSCSAGNSTNGVGTSAAVGCLFCSLGQFSGLGTPCVSESQTTMFFFCTNIHKYIDNYIIYYIYTHHSSTFLFSLFSLTLRTCTLGKRQNAALQTNCAKGKYATDNGATSCKMCHVEPFSRGWYQDDVGQTSCKQCPKGWSATNDYNANPPSYPNPTTECTICPVGRFAVASGTGICVRSYV